MSVFMWDNDKKKKHIVHPLDWPIPLIPVNEADDAFVLFNSSHSTHFPDNTFLVLDGAYPRTNPSEMSTTQRDNDLDQKSEKHPSPGFIDNMIPISSIVWHSNKERRRIAIIYKHMTQTGPPAYSICPLNSKKWITIPEAEVTAIQLEPTNIPRTHKDVDSQLMTECLSSEELAQIWTGDSDNTISTNARLTLYWYHRLCQALLTCLHWLVTRGVFPRSILRITKLPLAACVFATAHRRSWRNKSKDENSICQPHHDAPGRGTSYNHVISYQPGLIPHSTGILTHDKFWGSVLFADNDSDFIHNHLITGTTSIATLEAKQAYKRAAAVYGIRVKSYHADNLRFNDNNFKSDFI